jgi:L-asparaginase / beta-aspartyl-peptidase
MAEFSIAIHGGAGVISKDQTDPKPFYDALRRVIQSITQFAQESKENIEITAVDVAEFAVRLLEDEELFNAGKGSVFTSDETHELEASIMNGTTLDCGAVSLLRTTRNPISAARKVMENTEHIYLIGPGAESLAEKSGLAQVEQSYFSTERRRQHLQVARAQDKALVDHDPSSSTASETPSKTGTVGCVCFYKSHLAAATSTGGMTNKLSGRVGDTPIIGAGTYANDKTCAISATGRGEDFIRHVVAYDISARMEYAGCSLQEACRGTVHDKLPSGSGGVIAVDRTGNICFDWNSGGMFRASVVEREGGNLDMGIGIWEETIAIEMST